MILLVVLDVAGDLARIEAAKQALADRLEPVRKHVYIGLLRANDGLQVVLDPTGDRAAVREAVARAPVGNKAGMLDTIVQAARLADTLTQRSDVRAAVLYVTDSEVGNYREDFTNPVINWSDERDLSRKFPEGLIREKMSKLQDTLGAVQAPVYFVHLHGRTDRLNDAYQNGLMNLVTLSGGTGVFCRSITEIPDAIARVIDSALAHYLVWVQAPAKKTKSAALTIETSEGSPFYRSRFAIP
jgi:hypothetical protein